MTCRFEDEANLSFTQGDDVRYTFTLYQDDAATIPADLTGSTAAAQIRSLTGALVADFTVVYTDLVMVNSLSPYRKLQLPQ